MLITEFVDVKIGSKNIKHYRELGYDVELRQIITIPTEHLTIGSHVEIEVKCDYCGDVIVKVYKNYLRQRSNDKDYCIKCVSKKSKEICLEKFGVENKMQLEETKNKLKQTMLDKYGVENISQTPQWKEKCKSTCLEKYGTEYYLQTDEAKLNTSNFWKNISDEELKSIKDKSKETCLDRYGVEYISQVAEFKEKAIQTLLNNGNGIPTSSQQIEVFEMVELLCGEDSVVLNHPFDYYVLDIAVFLDKLKIDIEYDGWYWHDERRDKQRNNYLKHNYWKILRIKSGHKLPTIKQLQEKLDILINTDKKYEEIILDDWKEKEVAV